MRHGHHWLCQFDTCIHNRSLGKLTWAHQGDERRCYYTKRPVRDVISGPGFVEVINSVGIISILRDLHEMYYHKYYSLNIVRPEKNEKTKKPGQELAQLGS